MERWKNVDDVFVADTDKKEEERREQDIGDSFELNGDDGSDEDGDTPKFLRTRLDALKLPSGEEAGAEEDDDDVTTNLQ